MAPFSAFYGPAGADSVSINSNLNTKQSTITGAASTIASQNLTANRALVSNGSGKVAVSDVTATELGYLNGVTSNVQTQLNNKLSATGTAESAKELATARNITIGNETKSFDGTGNISFNLRSAGAGDVRVFMQTYEITVPGNSDASLTLEIPSSIASYKVALGIVCGTIPRSTWDTFLHTMRIVDSDGFTQFHAVGPTTQQYDIFVIWLYTVI